MSDLISRSELLRHISFVFEYTDTYNYKLLKHIVDSLPTVQERPKGEWEEKNDRYGYFCSVCGELLPCSEEYDFRTDFCPNCGADMRKGEEE